MLLTDARYPHLLEVDALLWHQHRLKFEDRYERFDYDVNVGTGRDPGSDFPDNIRQMAVRLSTRRIDAIGFRGPSIDIFEVTHSAGFTAVGQLVSYPILYRLTFGTDAILTPILVAGRVQTDIQPVLDRLHIPVYQYRAPESPSEQRSPTESGEVSDQTE